MSFIISNAVAVSHANNIAKVFATAVTDEQREGFFQWMDGLITDGVSQKDRTDNAEHIVSCSPYDFLGAIRARHPGLLAEYTHHKERPEISQAEAALDNLFSDCKIRPFSSDKLIDFIDSMLALVGYEINSSTSSIPAFMDEFPIGRNEVVGILKSQRT